MFVTSRSFDNPCNVGDIFTLETGLYLVTVMRNRRMLWVRYATKDLSWRKHPDL